MDANVRYLSADGLSRRGFSLYKSADPRCLFSKYEAPIDCHRCVGLFAVVVGAVILSTRPEPASNWSKAHEPSIIWRVTAPGTNMPVAVTNGPP